MRNEWTPMHNGLCDQCGEPHAPNTTNLAHYRYSAIVAGENPEVIHHQWLCQECWIDLSWMAKAGFATFVRVPNEVIGWK